MMTNSPSFREKQFEPLRRDGRIVNAMTVDVEDYFQAQALAAAFERSTWDRQQYRVERNTDLILDLFAEAQVHATFFLLGWVAERHKALVHRIVAAGHELASHGYDHRRADEQTPEEFRHDVRRSKRLIEDIGGVAVAGYRAPTFSINHQNMWAFDILADEGYSYSSSISPIRYKYYGMPTSPRFAFYPQADGSLEEYPITTARIGTRNLPCGGGGFFRLLPYTLIRAGFNRVNRVDRRAGIFYIHPWEVDPDQPRARGVSFKSRFRHYLNLDKTQGRLRRLVHDLAWDRVDRVFVPGAAREGASSWE
ncbi:XrtA system polysaccharide deacetylase [Magnetospirillum molischianum]|uniref:Chitooligosaccharide deacetylase n=1 Tax=Magnetospirillum molischianum DSM 120 TaxID=1150626 RepID=H8FQB1_MAGML|nr:XrtA system polysaccharide deacetylase [Magnetospirillum molischianum]CCG40549.1 Polysaccharide deacetylase [Magnetospirillum molischianum DSM 120]